MADKDIATLITELEDRIPVDTDDDRITFAELIDLCGDTGFIYLAPEVFNIWERSSDRKSIEDLFCLFTDMSMQEYLERMERKLVEDDNA